MYHLTAVIIFTIVVMYTEIKNADQNKITVPAYISQRVLKGKKRVLSTDHSVMHKVAEQCFSKMIKT